MQGFFKRHLDRVKGSAPKPIEGPREHVTEESIKFFFEEYNRVLTALEARQDGPVLPSVTS
jgi:hypothetical protein